MNDQDSNPPGDSSLDALLTDLFADAVAQTEPSPALVARVLAQAQRQQRQRRWVLLGATLCGAIFTGLSLGPALAALGAVLEGLPAPQGLASAATLLPALLLALAGYGLSIYTEDGQYQ